MELQLRFQILFVCTGNICRSAMAEGFLRAYIPEEYRGRVTIKSAGTLDSYGYSPPQEAIDVMDQVHVDIRGHRSQGVTNQLMEQSNLVLAMEQEHVLYLQTLFPKYKNAIFLLGHFLKKSRVKKSDEIQDPYGQEVVVYERARDRIEKEIQRIFPHVLYIIDDYTKP